MISDLVFMYIESVVDRRIFRYLLFGIFMHVLVQAHWRSADSCRSGHSGTPRAALTCTRPVGRAGQVSLGAGSGLPRSSRFSQGYGPNVCLTLFCCCMAWCHIRELVWNWLDTQSRLKVVAAGRDPWLQSGLDFGTAEIQYLLYILYYR